MASESLSVTNKSGGWRNQISRFLLLFVCAIMAFSVSAQSLTVTGTVTDEEGEPMIGATVRVKDGKNVVATDVDGHYSIKADKGNVLEFSYVGYITESVTVANSTTINVTLKEDSKNLDEVVVVAYGSQKKSSITGAISQVGSKELEKRPVSSFTSALEGTVPGIVATGTYGSAGAAPTIRIRGVSTINGSASILYVVDGVPFDGNINDFNPSDIESISVLKDAASAALYGNRAANGVILITTKKGKSDRVSITFSTNQGWFQRGTPEYDLLGANEWMTAIYTGIRNQQFANNLGNGMDRAAALSAATSYAQQNTIADVVKLNIYNVADNQLFQENGQLNPGVSILPGYLDDLNWYDQAIHNGYRGEYNLSGSGASEKSDYRFSVGYLDENGYIINNRYERLSGSASVNVKPTNWIKSGLSLTATYQKNKNAKGSGDDSGSYTNAFMYCRNMAPVYPVHLHYKNDGITDPSLNGQYILDSGGNKQYDPGYYDLDLDGVTTRIVTRNQYPERHMIWENILNDDSSRRYTINATAYADIMLPYGITASVRGNVSLRNSRATGYDSAVLGDGASVNGRYNMTYYNYRTYTFQQQLRWNHTFDGKHSIELFAAHENYDYNYFYSYGNKQNEVLTGGKFASNFTETSSITGYKNVYKTESYLARVQYNFDDRYNFEAAYRRDGTSRFAPGKRWGNFGSVGANWVFSNEAFMKDQTWLQMGKLRADWGQVANDAAAGYYAYMGTVGMNTYGDEGAWVLNQRPAYDLSWETGESWGIGLEGRLFNRWNLSIEYYDKTNKDLIFTVNNSASAGATGTGSAGSTATINMGSIGNRGIEITTDVDIFANKDWTINLGVNFSTLKNVVKSLPKQYEGGYNSGQYRIQVGKSRYEWYTYHYVGVDMTDGNALYTPDFETKYIIDNGVQIGEGTSEIPADQWRKINGEYYVFNPSSYGGRFWAGSALPKVYGSFTPNIRWKNFHVSAMFTYSLGGKMMDDVYSGLVSWGGSTPSSLHKDILNSWTPELAAGYSEDSPNRISTAVLPQINGSQNGYNNATSDRWLITRNYFAFKNLNVTYSLPRNFLKKLDLNSANLSFSCENVFIHSARKGMEAMQSISGGQSNYSVTPRVFTFGLTVNI